VVDLGNELPSDKSKREELDDKRGVEEQSAACDKYLLKEAGLM